MMDEFNYNSSYSSGWKRLKREEADKEQQKAFDILQKDAGAGTLTHKNKQILDNTPVINTKAAGSANSMLSYEENQKVILDKINQLQIEMASMKQLLSNIHTNTEMIKAPNHKNATGSKLSRFFK